jgi:hypothetical protein
MKRILLALMIMFCMAGTRAYANDWGPYVYTYSQPAPIVINVPVAQTVWVPVTTVVNQPVVYYPSYMWANGGVVNSSWGIIEKHRCLFSPQRYYINYGPYRYRY